MASIKNRIANSKAMKARVKANHKRLHKLALEALARKRSR